MKTLANTKKKIVADITANAANLFKFVFVDYTPTDDGGVMFRTQVNDFAFNLRLGSTTYTDTQQNTLIGFMSKCNAEKFIETWGSGEGWNEWSIEREQQMIEKSALVFDVPYTRDTVYETEFYCAITSLKRSDITQVKLNVDAINETIAGQDFCIWSSTGFLLGTYAIQAIVERVQITQDEYMKYFASTC